MKIISFIFTLIFVLNISLNAFGDVSPSKVNMDSNHVDLGLIQKQRVIINPNAEGNLKYLPEGVTYLEDHRDTTLNNAEYSKGAPASRVTVSRSATSPATYFDANGTMQVTTTSNVARDSAGYYDETGWHAKTHTLLEGQSTNLLKDSYFADGTTTYWRSRNTGTVTTSNERTSPLYGATQVLKVVCTSNTDGFQTAAANKPSLSLNGNYCTKVLIRGTTTATSLSVFIDTDTGTDASTTFTPIDTDWQEIIVKLSGATVAEGANIGVQQNGAGNSTFYIAIIQCENQLYPSSFIPTTTAALTRGAESLAPSAAGNFPAPSGGNCLSFDGANASGDDYVSVANSATGNQMYGSTAYSVEAWFLSRSSGENSAGRIVHKMSGTNTAGYRLYVGSGNNLTWEVDYNTTDAVSGRSAAFSSNVWNHVVATLDASGNPKLYVNDITSSGNIQGIGSIVEDSSSTLYIGNKNTGDATFDGFIQSVRIYRNIALTADNVATLYAAGRYASNPLGTATAEYLFNEGTGTTLTDTIAANNGTISGATWSKDTHSGTVLLEYMPVMLPNEQDASFKSLFFYSLLTNDYIKLGYDTNANNRCSLYTYSNSNPLPVNSSALTTWTRYSTHTLIGTWSTTADGAGKKINFYIDGVSVGTNANFAVPTGVLPATFSIQSSTGQAMGLRRIIMWDRVLSASEVKQATFN